MPRLSQWMIRVALVYLVLGFSLGWCLLMTKAGWFSWSLWRWHPIHLECLLVGWLFHLSLGVAYWMFPRINRIYRPRSGLAWCSFGLINIGLWVVCFGQWWGGYGGVVGRAIECLALVLFALHLWPRVKAFDV